MRNIPLPLRICSVLCSGERISVWCQSSNALPPSSSEVFLMVNLLWAALRASQLFFFFSTALRRILPELSYWGCSFVHSASEGVWCSPWFQLCLHFAHIKSQQIPSSVNSAFLLETTPVWPDSWGVTSWWYSFIWCHEVTFAPFDFELSIEFIANSPKDISSEP